MGGIPEILFWGSRDYSNPGQIPPRAGHLVGYIYWDGDPATSQCNPYPPSNPRTPVDISMLFGVPRHTPLPERPPTGTPASPPDRRIHPVPGSVLESCCWPTLAAPKSRSHQLVKIGHQLVSTPPTGGLSTAPETHGHQLGDHGPGESSAWGPQEDVVQGAPAPGGVPGRPLSHSGGGPPAGRAHRPRAARNPVEKKRCSEPRDLRICGRAGGRHPRNIRVRVA